MVDTKDLKSFGLLAVRVRVSFWALYEAFIVEHLIEKVLF